MLQPSRWAVRLSRLSKNSVRAASSNRPSKSHPLDYRPKASPPQARRISPTSSRSSGAQNQQPDTVSKEASKAAAISNALEQSARSGENDLLAPVHLPKDPEAILTETHPAMSLLANSSIIIRRQLEMMNIFLGFEQANRYVIMDPEGNTIGYLAERDHGLGSAVARQAFKTHRSFTTHVFDKNEQEVLRFHRPFALINSNIRIYDCINRDPNAPSETSTDLQGLSVNTAAHVSSLPLEQMRIIGETRQQWALLRRKYNMFLHRQKSDIPRSENAPQLTAGDLPLSSSTALEVVDERHPDGVMVQWAYCDEPFLSWDFSLLSEDKKLVGSVNRNFGGFAREIFTDTGTYALRMDAAGLASEPNHLISKTGSTAQEHTPGMTLDQRAVMLATAVSIDFDYFSRHSSSPGGLGMWPLWMPWGGGAAEAGAAGGAAGGAVGAAEGATGVAGEVAGAARGVGAATGEGAIAGAGTMAGYEAMQRGWGNNSPSDDASPQADPTAGSASQPPPESQTGASEDVWGSGQDPWAGNSQESSQWGGQGGSGTDPTGGAGGDVGGGGDVGEGIADWFKDLF
jgi:hypothetical protein